MARRNRRISRRPWRRGDRGAIWLSTRMASGRAILQAGLFWRRAMARDLTYIHRYEPGADPTLPPILLLHGTGGDETDLIPLGRAIAPGAALLSPRGNVLEGDRPRFFRRFGEGLFDEDDVRR